MRLWLMWAFGPCLAWMIGAHMDDWALVDKYCPLSTPKFFPNEGTSKFFLYRDSEVYERAIRGAFEGFLVRGSGPGAAKQLEKESEFFGEVEIWCDLIKHPARTWDANEASAFIVPAFPYLLPEMTSLVANQLKMEPSWQRHQGSDHVIICTHWGCINRIGPLFDLVALPGFIATLERNLKWLDPRLFHVDMDHGWQRVFPTPLQSNIAEHPLCPERIIVLPYPAHPGVIKCRPHPSRNKTQTMEQRNIQIFFAGAVRSKLCGINADGSERHVDPSHGVRPALRTESLIARYIDLYTSSEDMIEKLRKAGFFLQVFGTGAHGGRRIGGLEGSLSYPTMLQKSRFCLHLRGDTPTSRRFYDAVASGCLPIIVSNQFGGALPFTLGGDVDYGAWVTIIDEARFVADPIGEMLAAVAQLEGSREDAMREAMARDAPKLTLCSGTGAVGDLMIREIFKRMHFRGNSLGCLQRNNEDLLPLYVTDGQSAHTAGGNPTTKWLALQEARYGTNWTWCTEVVSRFTDYIGDKIIFDQNGNSLRTNEIVHVS